MVRDDFPLEQSWDETLKNAFEQVCSIDGQPLQSARPPSYPYFAILKDRLYQVTQDTQIKQDTIQLLVPKSRREMLFQATHYNPMAGHLGQAATLNRLMTRFFWLECAQVVRGLSWMSVSESPDLPKSAIAPSSSFAGPLRENWYGPHRAIRTVSTGASLCIGPSELCNTIPGGSGAPQHFREKCGKCSVSYNLPSGNPERDSHGSSTPFMSRTIRKLYGLLGIKSVCTSVYHPQTDGLVERFNRTWFVTMIRKFVHEEANNWDKWLEPLLFAVREVP